MIMLLPLSVGRILQPFQSIKRNNLYIINVFSLNKQVTLTPVEFPPDL